MQGESVSPESEILRCQNQILVITPWNTLKKNVKIEIDYFFQIYCLDKLIKIKEESINQGIKFKLGRKLERHRCRGMDRKTSGSPHLISAVKIEIEYFF